MKIFKNTKSVDYVGKKKTISNTNSKEKIYSKQKQNPIDYIFLKIRKKNNLRKKVWLVTSK